MSYDYDDAINEMADAEHAQEEYDKEIVDEALSSLSSDRARDYLTANGDSIQDRVEELKGMSKSLSDNKFNGPAVVVAVTAVEVIIRYFILRPLCQGMFLQDLWADELLARVLNRRTATDRELLPKIVGHWGVDLPGLVLENRKPAWECFDREMRNTRNMFVHAGRPVSSDDAQTAIEIIDVLVEQVVKPITAQLGLNGWDSEWSKCGGSEVEKRSPFLQ